MAGTDRPLQARLRQAAPTLLLIAGAGATALLLSRLNPYAADSVLPPCPFHALTGLYCPGCGSTRALHALLHGDVMQAMAMNPLLVIALPLLALMACNAAGWLPQGSERFRRSIGNPKLWLAVLLGYWILRNLPWWPFAWLAPG